MNVTTSKVKISAELADAIGTLHVKLYQEFDGAYSYTISTMDGRVIAGSSASGYVNPNIKTKKKGKQ
jgi:hypothetical protein